MAYSALADLQLQLDEAHIQELTDDGNIGAVDTDVVARAIADADAEIDSYLAVRYALPLAATPAIVRLISVELAICNLYARRRETLPDTRKERCERWRNFLDMVAKGAIGLGADDPGASSSDGPKATTSKDDRVFTLGRESDSFIGTLDDF